MSSLGLLLIVFVATFVVNAWVIARTARAVGSTRGRWRTGLAVIAILHIVAIAFIFIESRLAPTQTPLGVPSHPNWRLTTVQQPDPARELAVALFLLVLPLMIMYLVIKRAFRLSAARAVAPLGAMVGLQVFWAAVALLGVRPFIAAAFVQPTNGMSPAMEPGDRFVANKLIRPQRWDISAYHAGGQASGQVFCQRIVGLPGERLRFEQGAVWVNDQRLTPPPHVKTVYSASPRHPKAAHSASPSSFRSLYQDGQTIALGADEYFLVGDNIDISYDSRFLGPATTADLVGVADLRYWPLRRLALLR